MRCRLTDPRQLRSQGQSARNTAILCASTRECPAATQDSVPEQPERALSRSLRVGGFGAVLLRSLIFGDNAIQHRNLLAVRWPRPKPDPKSAMDIHSPLRESVGTRIPYGSAKASGDMCKCQREKTRYLRCRVVFWQMLNVLLCLMAGVLNCAVAIQPAVP